MRRLSLLIGLTPFLMVTTSLAASGSLTSGSGSQASGSGSVVSPYPVESPVLLQERADRTQDFHVKFLQSKQDEALFREKQATYEKKRAEFRSLCRDDLRRANRDTQFAVLLRCYKGDLGLEKDYLLQQRNVLQTMAGLSPAVRINAQNKIDLLTDAIGTVTLAMESGVYTTTDDLLEAKKNLLQKYREPWWAAITDVRADQSLTWTQYLITQVDAIRAAEMAQSAERTEWVTPRKCLVQAETDLHTFLNPDAIHPPAFGDVLSSLHTCLPMLSAVSPLKIQSGSMQSSSSSKAR